MLSPRLPVLLIVPPASFPLERYTPPDIDAITVYMPHQVGDSPDGDYFALPPFRHGGLHRLRRRRRHAGDADWFRRVERRARASLRRLPGRARPLRRVA